MHYTPNWLLISLSAPRLLSYRREHVPKCAKELVKAIIIKLQAFDSFDTLFPLLFFNDFQFFSLMISSIDPMSITTRKETLYSLARWRPEQIRNIEKTEKRSFNLIINYCCGSSRLPDPAAAHKNCVVRLECAQFCSRSFHFNFFRATRCGELPACERTQPSNRYFVSIWIYRDWKRNYFDLSLALAHSQPHRLAPAQL